MQESYIYIYVDVHIFIHNHSPTSIIKNSPKIDTMNKNTSDKKDKSDCADSIAVNVKDSYQISADIISTENYDSQLEKIGVEISKRAEEIKKFPDDKKFNIRSRIIFLKKNVTAVLYDFLSSGNFLISSALFEISTPIFSSCES